MSSKPTLKLDWCSHRAAKYACEHWHYSGIIPCGKLAKIGVWENRQFIGSVVYGDGILGRGKNAYGIPKIEIAQLVRLALREHKTPCSRIIRVSIKLMTEAMPGLRLLVSFADTGQDHLGTIYQAANWVYTGRIKSQPVYVHKETGVVYHNRNVSQSGTASMFGRHIQVPKTEECDKFPGTDKHRYMYPLDKEMRAWCEERRQLYPKRSPDRGASPQG